MATPAAAADSTVTGTSTTLSVLGADDGGEANLTYAWAGTSTLPTGVTETPTFSFDNGTSPISNGTKNATVTFYGAGTYRLR